MVLLAVLAVPADRWPEGSSWWVGGGLALVGLVAGTALWAYLFEELVGERSSELRADAVGFQVRKLARTRSPAGNRPQVFGRWSEIERLEDGGDHLRVVRVGREDLRIPTEGLRREERVWLLQRLEVLNRVNEASGEVPAALGRLAGRLLDRHVDRG